MTKPEEKKIKALKAGDFERDPVAARSAEEARRVKRIASAAKNKKAKRRTGGTPGQLRRAAEEGFDISEARATVHVGKTSTAILTGQADLSSWTEEELIRGQQKGKDGRWTGRPPSIVPKAIHDELVKRTLSAAGEVLRTNLVAGVTALGEIAQDPDAPEASRIRAIEIIMDRTMGKAPDRVEISAEMPWLDALTDSIVATEEDFTQVILDAESQEKEA